MKQAKIYVNMTDKFMSGWGLARGRSIYCIECDTWEQAEAIESAARRRPEMIRVAISDRPRRMGPGGDHRSITPFSEMGGPWLADYRPAKAS